MSCTVTGNSEETAFAWKTTTESDYTRRVAAFVSGTQASATLTELLPDTDYEIRATAMSGGTEYASAATRFRTARPPKPQTDHTAWYELPARSEGATLTTLSFYAGGERNYTVCYDRSTYTSCWVAYPLARGHIGSGRKGSWAATPGIDIADQINVWDGSYGVDYGENDLYARGHQIPNGDRNANSAMQRQTFYSVNSTPQIQNRFNGGIWNTLEGAVRSLAQATADTVYVTTGAVLRTAAGSEEVAWIQPQYDAKQCPVPNYYYKALLKVRRSGGRIVAASAVGVWMPHRSYSGDSYMNYVVTVDEIERLTGFDLFANLPDDVEAKAERNASWSDFAAF